MRFIWKESLSFINSLSATYFVIAFYGYPLPLFQPIWAYLIYKNFIYYLLNLISLLLLEAVARTCSVKKAVLEIVQISQESTYARASFLIKLEDWGLQLYQKRVLFLWILQNF